MNLSVVFMVLGQLGLVLGSFLGHVDVDGSQNLRRVTTVQLGGSSSGCQRNFQKEEAFADILFVDNYYPGGPPGGYPPRCGAPPPPPPQKFPIATAAKKTEALWKKVKRNPYTKNTLPTAQPCPLEFAQLGKTEFAQKVFTHLGDEMINGRKKMVHPYGVVGTVKLEIFPDWRNTYTGMFYSGGIGLLRLSWANFNNQSVVPSAALKIFVDGQDLSENMVLLFNGQGTDLNFFTNPISNIFPAAVLAPNATTLDRDIAKAFLGAIAGLPCGPNDRPEGPNNIPVYEPAMIYSNGTPVRGRVVEPYRIEFVAPGTKEKPALRQRYNPAKDDSKDFRTVLSEIPNGATLYNVIAYWGRNTTSQSATIGRIILTSELVASAYGDEKLYFRHNVRRSLW